MTLTSSRISDEFKLILDIFHALPGFDIPFRLYPNLMINVHRDGHVDLVERDRQQHMTTRAAARYILNRWW